jgi:hypothetical protein
MRSLSFTRPQKVLAIVKPLAIVVSLIAAGSVIIYGLINRPAIVFVAILWGIAIATMIVPVRSQLLIFWALIPFADFLKRLVFLDPGAGTVEMYLVLGAQDILLLTVVVKFILVLIRKPLTLNMRKADFAVALFGLYAFVSALTSPNAPIQSRIAAVGLRVWPVFFYFIAAHYLNNLSMVKLITKITVVLAFIVAMYGIQQFFVGLSPAEVAWMSREGSSQNVAHLQKDQERGVFRTFGTMDSHTSYGIFLGMGLILIRAVRRWLGHFLWIILSIIVLVGLIISFTRLTWLMPLLAVGYILLFSIRKIRPLLDLKRLRRASLLLLVVIGSFAVFYGMMSFLYGRKLFSTSNPYLSRALTTGTLEARLRLDYLWGGGEVGLFGKGLANSSYFALRFNLETSDVNYHNIFIDMTEELGILGLLIFIWLLYEMFKNAIRNISLQTHPYSRGILVAYFGLILGMITIGHFNGAVFYFGHAMPFYFWGICGILTHYQDYNTVQFAPPLTSSVYSVHCV